MDTSIDPIHLQQQELNQLPANSSANNANNPIQNEAVQHLLEQDIELDQDVKNSFNNLLDKSKIDSDALSQEAEFPTEALSTIDQQKVNTISTIFNKMEIGTNGSQVTDDDIQTVEHMVNNHLDAPMAVAEEADQLDALINETSDLDNTDEVLNAAQKEGMANLEDYQGWLVPVVATARRLPEVELRRELPTEEAHSENLNRIEEKTLDSDSSRSGSGYKQQEALEEMRMMLEE